MRCLFLIAASMICGLCIQAEGQIPFSKKKPMIQCSGVSPDGKYLATIITIEGKQRLGVFEFNTQELRFIKLVGTSTPCCVDRVSWSPDGRDFAFVLLTKPARIPEQRLKQNMVEQNAKTPDPEALFQVGVAAMSTGFAKQITHGNEFLWQYPRFSSQGRLLLCRDAYSLNVGILDVKWGWLGFLLPTDFWSLGHVYRFGYDWGPKGQYAYLSVGYDDGKVTKKSGIWRIDLGTGSKTRLSEEPGAYILFVSPSGQWLAYSVVVRKADTRDVSWRVHVASLPDFKVRTASEHATEWLTTWSKKNDRLAFCEKGRISIWSPKVDKPAYIPVPEGQPQSVSWIGSTDSIVYSIDNEDIWVLDTGSGERKRLITTAEVLDNEF